MCLPLAVHDGVARRQSRVEGRKRLVLTVGRAYNVRRVCDGLARDTERRATATTATRYVPPVNLIS